MSKEDVIEVEGVVVEAMPNAMFLVEIQGGHRLLAHISGKLRMNFIRIPVSYTHLDVYKRQRGDRARGPAPCRTQAARQVQVCET